MLWIRGLDLPPVLWLDESSNIIKITWWSFNLGLASCPRPMRGNWSVGHVYCSWLQVFFFDHPFFSDLAMNSFLRAHSASINALLANAVGQHLGEDCSLKWTTKVLVPSVARPTSSIWRCGWERISRSSWLDFRSSSRYWRRSTLKCSRSASFFTKDRGYYCCCYDRFYALLANQVVAQTSPLKTL